MFAGETTLEALKCQDVIYSAYLCDGEHVIGDVADRASLGEKHEILMLRPLAPSFSRCIEPFSRVC